MVGYIAQFLLIIVTINMYSDNARLNRCGGATTGAESSEIYDIAFVLLASYPLIEWFRHVLFMTAIFLGVNFFPIWYVLKLNTLFGIAAYCVAHARRFSEQGKDCAMKDEAHSKQEFRAEVLIAEVIIFWITFIPMSFP